MEDPVKRAAMEQQSAASTGTLPKQSQEKVDPTGMAPARGEPNPLVKPKHADEHCKLTQETNAAGNHRLVIEIEGTALFSEWTKNTDIAFVTCPKTGRTWCSCTEHFGEKLPRCFEAVKYECTKTRV